MSKKLLIEYSFLSFLGILTSLSLPPFNYFIINFITLSLFFIFLEKKRKSHKIKKLFFFYGWFFGLGYFVSNLYWISISLTFDPNFKYLIPLAILLIPAFLSVFYGLVTYSFFFLKTKRIIFSMLIFSLLFAIFEFIRGALLTGFPWNLFVYSFSNQLEIISIISIIGTYGLNLICISLFISPVLLFMRDNKKDIILSIFFVALFLIFYAYGHSLKKKFHLIDDVVSEYKLRVINSNIGLDRFYSDNSDPVEIINELINISKPTLDEKIIFIWPEGILPGVKQRDLINFKWLFEGRFNENHFLIIGLNSRSISDGSIKYFNTFSLFDHELNLLNSYNKINLVPFGEFLPFEKILSIIGLKTITNNYQSFSRGEIRNIIEIKKNNFSLKILPLICYEIIYSGQIFRDNDFDLIINLSEDGWFGKSIGPKQHFAHSIFRSIESGKYVIRSTNNGISAIINPMGTVEKSLNYAENGYIDLKIRKKIQPTVFSVYGNKVFGILILLYIFLLFSISFTTSFNRIKNF